MTDAVGRAGNPSVGRHTFHLFHGYHDTERGVSLFDDIWENVNEITGILGLFSQNIKRNSWPHLFGSDGLLPAADGR